MKIEFLENGSPDFPLIRIYDFDESEVRTLFDAITALSNGSSKSVAIHELPKVESVAHCHLTAESTKRDIGVSRIRNEENSFLWELKPSGWDNVAGLIEPFLERLSGAQFLDSPSKISVLLSWSGDW